MINHTLKLGQSRTGNKIVIVKNNITGESFSIQTNDNLPFIHSQGIEKKSLALVEITNYVMQFGTLRQKRILEV